MDTPIKELTTTVQSPPPLTTQQMLESQVDNLLTSRKYFIDKVLPILVENQDYYSIKGKKSLAKGGAEKLATIFNFVASFEMDKDTLDMLKIDKLVAYICNLKDQAGNLRGQGRGADSIIRNQNDPNKTIKMAQKRAYIDAVMRATGLSDIFTQDFGPDDHPELYRQPVHQAPRPVNPPLSSPKPAVEAPTTVKTAQDTKEQLTNALKRQIVDLCDKIDGSIDLMEDKKKGYEECVKVNTGFELKPDFYKMIITRLTAIVEQQEKTNTQILETIK